jgi:hypothetical protein
VEKLAKTLKKCGKIDQTSGKTYNSNTIFKKYLIKPTKRDRNPPLSNRKIRKKIRKNLK